MYEDSGGILVSDVYCTLALVVDKLKYTDWPSVTVKQTAKTVSKPSSWGSNQNLNKNNYGEATPGRLVCDNRARRRL